jgi:predicted PurR-regulated permease PerM
VHPLIVLFATLAGTALYGIIGAIFAVPVVAIVSATLRYLQGTLVYERWDKPPIRPAEQEPDEQELVTPSMPAGTDDDGEE